MADRLAGGNLARLLAEARSSDVSYEAIARELYAKYGIEVTRQTVANWVNDLGLVTGKAGPEEAAS